MKKSYAAAIIAANGNVVRETLCSVFVGPECEFCKPMGAGAIGFYV